MERDFTFRIYRRFLQALLQVGYSFITVENYFRNKAEAGDKYVILRHDVDKRPFNSLATAKIENELGIQSTYYFRALDCSYDEEVISAIIDMKHEFGYHYEDLTLARGDTDKAYRLFEENLRRFRTVGPVSTICMHGSPLSSWDNRDIWEYFDYREHDILGEPYLDIDFGEVFYFTDTGRKWNRRTSRVRDKVSSQQLEKFTSVSTLQLIKFAKKNELPRHIMINTHPQRWNDAYLPWIKELITQNVKNLIKKFIIKRN